MKSIEKTAEEHSEDPFLIAMAERAQAVQESFEDRQTSTAEALEELIQGGREERAAKEGAGGEGTRWTNVLCALQADRRRHPQPGDTKPESCRGLYQVSKLAAKRGGAAGSAEKGNIRYLRRGGRH